MEFEQLIQKLQAFKSRDTSQTWRKDDKVNYENDYICLARIASSNVAGGASVNKGKQWSIIINLKKSFSGLPNWKMLKNYFARELNITEVNRGVHAGKYGIRLYRMSADPTDEIIYDLLDFIFEKA